LLQIFLGAIIISFSSVFVKMVHTGPTSTLFYRFLFGGVALIIALMITKTPLFRSLRTLGLAAASGLLFSLDLFLWHRSILFVGPGLATILAGFQIFILPLIGVLFLKEHLKPLFIISIILAFAGLVFLTGADVNSMEPQFRIGIVYGMLTAVCYSGITLTIQISQKLSHRLDPIANMAWLCIFGAFFGSFEVVASHESFIIPDIRSLFFLITYGVVCSSIGWYLITKGLPHVSISMAGLSLILQPALSFLWDVLFFKKPVSFMNAIGAVIALSAMYIGALSRSR
jgi:drug/metabolite transporter (DMT)-like permease